MIDSGLKRGIDVVIHRGRPAGFPACFARPIDVESQASSSQPGLLLPVCMPLKPEELSKHPLAIEP